MKKILYYSIGFLVFLLLFYFFYYKPNVEKINEDIYLEKSTQIRDLFANEIRSKQSSIGNMVYLLSQNKELIKALEKNDKNIIDYKDILDFLNKNSDYRNLWLHIIDKNGNSFYRSWTEKSGENLLEVREDLKELFKNPRQTQNISSGLYDLTLKTIQPVFNKNGKFLGFIEFISKFNSIAKNLEKENISPIFLLSQDKSKKLLEPFSKIFVDGRYVANIDANRDLLDLIQKNGINYFLNIWKYKLLDKYLVTNIMIRDTSGDEMGLFLMFYEKSKLNKSQLSDFINQYITLIIIFSLLYSIIFLYLLKSIYAKKLDAEIKIKTERIKSQSEKLEKLVEIYDKNVIFSRTDLKGIITHASSAFCKISGYTKYELIGEPHSIVRHPDTPKEIFTQLWNDLKEEKKVTLEIKNMKKDGSYYWVIADLEPEYDDKGKLIGYYAVREDITANKDIEEIQREIIFTMGSIAESRSKETGEHVKRVSKYSKILALGYGLPKASAKELSLASPMHDIGKIAIPDSILNKPAKLTAEEFEEMKTHAQKGFEMLNVSTRPLLQTAANIALTHHEKFDGTGYPNGLKGEEIPIFGRITALADVFDAISSDRCYKKAWPLDEALNYIKEQSGKHFDPKLVEVFFNNINKILEVKEKHKDIE
ncbi:Cyclic di-GMP phosphodiesterase response regulator RpfG [Aliarcobacter thereius]|uniref:Cyclic di-GMP phosphodiesterase response regulator RpfG n=1 Tax=Aliarcobacter thereius LMG 24486 TaxID=1032240 RepID=A0A1C7WRC1_9BACT|nr:HD domain-containing phosphohydrolase [Aliarcobacter thereius]OCL86399.1 Cyclic di-GMP phosphodiesterase response regulator RpfG [Aliarcobacter thereius]OCL90084.1 Cyclic di-GMP phosphodiesterase response regulator RpfG [Aliarcobacter thereius]OCL96316.1 Cyclic di-GMP phosphodiesterase response regulator RpfG [Aliarcobacter thereius LMG 24486]QBF15721.1 multi-sensor domain-containing response regulator c-di-GMP phosphodiesterase, RpfG family [Aliarcobacter thereius LMG 24486]TLS92496.1 PAS 